MREIISKAYLMDGTEFALLLSSCGKKSIYCFPFVKGDENRTEYIYSIEKLAKKGIITPDSKGFTVNAPYNEMMDYIKKSDKVAVFRFSDADVSDFCVYISGEDKLPVVSLPMRKNSVRLSFETREDFFERYIREGLPEGSDSTLEPSDEGFDETALSIMSRIRKGEPVDDLSFLMGIDVLSNDGEEHQTVLVLQLPRGIYLIRYDEIGSEAERYTKENASELIKCILKGI